MKMILQTLVYSLFIWLSIACAPLPPGDPKMIPIGALPDELKENSGLVMIAPDTYVGHNDSGNEPYLYQFSIQRKVGTRTIKVTNATNMDWEELTTDDTYIYIADTGNNAGGRRDLCIYRVSINDVKKNSEVIADKITFSYPEQKNFKPSNRNNFDCEAMVCVNDSLYLFTKNRGNQRSDVYAISKVPGDYKASHRGSFEAEGLITGAAFRKQDDTNELILVGYKTKKENYHPFLIHFSNVPGTEFFKGEYNRKDFPGSVQIESVIFKDAALAYMANEEEHGDQGLIYKVDLSR